MRTIGDVAVEDVDGVIHFVDTDFTSKTECYGFVELKFVRCLNIADETDEDFSFESEQGKKICTDIVLFILSLISQRPTRIQILKLEFFRDENCSTAAKTIATYDEGNIKIRLRFNLALSKGIVRFILLALHELSHALSSPKSGHDVKKNYTNFGCLFSIAYYKVPEFVTKQGIVFDYNSWNNIKISEMICVKKNK